MREISFRVYRVLFKEPEKLLKYLKRAWLKAINVIYITYKKLKKLPYICIKYFLTKLSPELSQKIRSNKLVQILKARYSFAVKSPRRYVHPKYDRTQFFGALNERNINYVLLRWWEKLPNFPAHEDMDLLIDDEDVDKVQDLFVDFKTENFCDIYTPHGSRNGGYKGLLYYTPIVSASLLGEKCLFNEVAYVPSPMMNFVSLSYHALFHKGASSGVPGFGSMPDKLEHDYYQKLSELRDELSLDVEIAALPLFDWLGKRGFAPDEDTLTKLVDINAELKIFAKPLYCNAEGGELCVFVIREKAIKDGLETKFLEIIKENKLEILKVVSLTKEEMKTCAKKMRGGVWDNGAYTLSGGLPEKLVICFDYHPQPPSPKQSSTHRWVTNRHILKIKTICRNYIENNRFYTKQYNGLHTADNEREALHYMQTISSDLVQEVSNRTREIRHHYKTRMPVIKVLSEGRRSKVELVTFNNGLAVKKTYRDSSLRYLKREIYAYENLSGADFVAPLLSKGDNYFITPFFENVLVGKEKKILIDYFSKNRTKIIDVIKLMHSQKLMYINFTPENVIITPQGELYAIDFEFLQPYEGSYPHNVENSIEVLGIPADYEGDLPEGYNQYNSCFNQVWAPYLGKW